MLNNHDTLVSHHAFPKVNVTSFNNHGHSFGRSHGCSYCRGYGRSWNVKPNGEYKKLKAKGNKYQNEKGKTHSYE